MKSVRTIAICCAGIALIAAISVAAPHQIQSATPHIAWQTDLAAAHRESLESHKPMLIVFSADWCQHCRRMNEVTLTDASIVKSVNQDYIPVQLDLAKHAREAEILEVKRIPCTVILNPQADLLGRVVGCVTSQQYHHVLDQVSSRHAELEQRIVQAASNVRAQ